MIESGVEGETIQERAARQYAHLTRRGCVVMLRSCIAPNFSFLPAPSAFSLVGGCRAWEGERAPSSAALTRRAAPPMQAMGGAAFVSELSSHRWRSRRSRARTRLGGRTITFTVERAAMRQPPQSPRSFHATPSHDAAPERDATDAAGAPRAAPQATRDEHAPTSDAGSGRAIPQADGDA